MANTIWKVTDNDGNVLNSGETGSTSGVISYTIPDNYEGLITFKIYDSNNEDCSYTIKKTVECCKIEEIHSRYPSNGPASSTGTAADRYDRLVDFTATCKNIYASSSVDWIDDVKIPGEGAREVIGRFKPNTTERQRSGVIIIKKAGTSEVLGEVSVYQKAKEACPNPNPSTVLFNIDDDIGNASFVDFTSDVWVVTSTNVSSNISDYIRAELVDEGVKLTYFSIPHSVRQLEGTIDVALTAYGETVEKTINVVID